MKNPRPLLSSLLIFAALAAAPILHGCKSPETTAYKATAITVSSVDAAMSAYGDAVRAGQVPANAQAQVKSAYDKYYAAMLIESAAVQSFKANPDTNMLYKAIGAATAASAEIVGLVEQFLPPDKLLKLKGLQP